MNIKVKRLHHVQICIPPGAEDEAREFYGVLLGLNEIEKPAQLKKNGGLWFEIGDVQLHIGVEDAPASSKRHPAFEVEDLASVENYLRGRGVKLREETPAPGMDRFSFFDPFGNRFELIEMTTAHS